MLTGIINRLRGQVRIRAESAFPERILNLCGARELAFWDVTWESPTAFTCRLSRRDWHILRQAAKHLDCELTVVGALFSLPVPPQAGSSDWSDALRHCAVPGLLLCLGLRCGGQRDRAHGEDPAGSGEK